MQQIPSEQEEDKNLDLTDEKDEDEAENSIDGKNGIPAAVVKEESVETKSEDIISTISSQPEQNNLYNLEFRGNTWEYFKIYMLNLFLTIITLGIYSPWAKVKNKRYLQSHIFLDNQNFEYHAKGKNIFLARLVIFVAILFLLVIGAVFPQYAITSGILSSIFFVLIISWAHVNSFSFNAKMSSYRNIRFNFNKKYAFMVYFYFMLATGLALFVLPWLMRGYHNFKCSNHEWGNLKFLHGICEKPEDSETIKHKKPSIMKYIMVYWIGIAFLLLVAAGGVYLVTTIQNPVSQQSFTLSFAILFFITIYYDFK